MIINDRVLGRLQISAIIMKTENGPNQSLDNLLQLAQTVYYGREYEEEKRTRPKTEAPATAVRSALKQPEEKCPEGPR